MKLILLSSTETQLYSVKTKQKKKPFGADAHTRFMTPVEGFGPAVGMGCNLWWIAVFTCSDTLEQQCDMCRNDEYIKQLFYL